MIQRTTADSTTDTVHEIDQHEFTQLLTAPLATQQPLAAGRIEGVRIGRLVGFAESGAVPLVTYPGQPDGGVPLPARALIDVRAPHFDRDLALLFEDSDPNRPIIIGCLCGGETRSWSGSPGQVEVDTDGQRLVLTAKEQIVLRCGKASITLTKEGKVLLQGAYISGQSSGVMRIKGGSVQIN
jgi:Domain of unknown function (DUF6484)